MNKFLVLFDGNHFSEGSLLFAQRINELEPVLLTGIFLPSVDYTELMNYYYIGGGIAPALLSAYEYDPAVIKENIERFQSFCLRHHIEHRMHDTIQGNVIEEIKKETRYADLLIISGELLYENLGPNTHEGYLEDLSQVAECPVLIVPEVYHFPETAVFAYDGGESTMHAMKQFIYLLPMLTELKTQIVYATGENKEIPDLAYMKEFAARHFNDLTFTELEADPKTYFNTWISDEKKPLLVTGSYGRSSLSLILKKSFAAEIIREHKMPVFIAHK